MTVLPTAFGPNPNGWLVKTVTGSPVTTLSFGAVDGLPDGDSAWAYDFRAAIAFNSAGSTIFIRPTATSTNQRGVGVFSVNGGAVGASASTGTPICSTNAAGFVTGSSGSFWSRRGAGGRHGQALASDGVSAAAMNQEILTWTWNEDATLITGIDFTAAVANGIGVGSMFMIRPLVR